MTSPPLAAGTRGWILAATILGSGMAFIDGTAVNTALPIMQADLHASVAPMQWVVEAYLLFLSALLLVGGALGDRLGRRKVYVAGVILFSVASAWCGLAPDTNQLIAARALQGLGGALLVPGSLAIISATFDPAERGRAIGTWSGFSAITSAFGQVFGGVLAQYVSWRAIFFINLPLALCVVAIAYRHVPETRDPQAPKALDWGGALLATVGLGALTLGLIQSGVVGFYHPLVWASLVGGCLALAAFLAVEARVKAPMMPLSLFRSRDFAGANALTLLLYGALGGSLFFVPFDLIQVQGYSPTAAGLSMLPFVALMAGLSRWSGGLVNRYGARGPLVIGPAIAAVGFALYALPGVGGSYWTTFFPAILVLGLGMTITVAPLTTTVMGAVGPERAGVASGVNNAVARVAGLVAIAVMGILMTQVFTHALDANLAHLSLPGPAREALKGDRDRLAAMSVPPEVPVAVRPAVHGAIRDAYVAGFRWVFLTNAGLALAGALAAALVIAGRPGKVARS